MKTIFVSILAALFLLTSGTVMAAPRKVTDEMKTGQGKSKGPNESAYEHANEKAKFQRNESTPNEKGKEAVGKGKEKGKKNVVDQKKKGQGAVSSEKKKVKE